MNGSRALIRLAASCGTNNFLCTACEGVVGRRQSLSVAAEFAHHERAHRAVLVRHRRGQIRGEVLRPGDDVVDRVPAAHRVEAGIADRMDRADRVHARVERIGILNELVIEQLEAEPAVAHGHPPSLSRGNGRRQCCAAKLKSSRSRVI